MLAERAKLSPHNPMIWNDLGVEYAAAAKPEQAHAAFIRAYKTFQDFPTPLYNLARLAMGHCFAERSPGTAPSEEVCKCAREAIGYLQDCLLQDPQLAQAHALLFAAYDAIGSVKLASVHRQRALQLKPDVLPERKRTFFEKLPFLSNSTHVDDMAFPFMSSSGESVHAIGQRLVCQK